MFLLPWGGSLGMQREPMAPAALPRTGSSHHPHGISQSWPPNALVGTAQGDRQLAG